MPVSRLSAVVALAALALPVVATSGVARPDDVAAARAELIRRDSRRAHRAADRVVLEEPLAALARRRGLSVNGGDVLSSSDVKNRVIHVENAAGKVSYVKVKGPALVPRGVDYDAESGQMAIAAVDQVVLLTLETGDAFVVPGHAEGAFEFANDVVFDGNGGLIIADQGLELTAKEPTDGSVWRYDLITGELTEIATSKQLSNPKLLARDKRGSVHFIDGGAGELVSPSFDVRWDLLYRVEGNTLARVKSVWKDAGIQATAYAIDAKGWHWIVNLAELIRIKGSKMERPCLPPYPLLFGTGLTIAADGEARVMDGASVLNRSRTIFTITTECVVDGKANRKLKGARGLTHVPDE
jgi:hypothetical protein